MKNINWNGFSPFIHLPHTGFIKFITKIYLIIYIYNRLPKFLSNINYIATNTNNEHSRAKKTAHSNLSCCLI
ncbi:MAG TPA: hypothetical protein PLD76_07190, partial [Paludibacteraceae bacterium]|nr:hypothetical protein [Paludibacteraceae bacterium]